MTSDEPGGDESGVPEHVELPDSIPEHVRKRLRSGEAARQNGENPGVGML